MRIHLSSKPCLLLAPLFTLQAATAPAPPIIDLLQAIANDNEDRFSELLFATPALAKATHHLGYTALHYAVGKGKVAFARLLIEEGADVSAEDSKKLTPLMWWTIKEHGATKALLLGAGAIARHGNPPPEDCPDEAAFAARFMWNKARFNPTDRNYIISALQTPSTSP